MDLLHEVVSLEISEHLFQVVFGNLSRLTETSKEGFPKIVTDPLCLLERYQKLVGLALLGQGDLAGILFLQELREWLQVSY